LGGQSLKIAVFYVNTFVLYLDGLTRITALRLRELIVMRVRMKPGILVRRVTSRDEVLKCVEMSLVEYAVVDREFLDVDKDYCIDNAMHCFQNGSLFNVLLEDGEIIAWILAAERSPFLHSRTRVLTQLYYHSFVHGIKAVRALKLAHQSMITHAVLRGIPLLQSNSYLHNSDVFNRVLSSIGWVVRGSMVMYQVTPDDQARVAREGAYRVIRQRPWGG
jgi:hypothetical protein